MRAQHFVAPASGRLFQFGLPVTDGPLFTTTPAPNPRRGGPQRRPLFRPLDGPLLRPRTLQTDPRHASHD
jgi:hypothetical protein